MILPKSFFNSTDYFVMSLAILVYMARPITLMICLKWYLTVVRDKVILGAIHALLVGFT